MFVKRINKAIKGSLIPQAYYRLVESYRSGDTVRHQNIINLCTLSELPGKTDLDLRPVYHKTDRAAMASLHLGLLAYWEVNTITIS